MNFPQHSMRFFASKGMPISAVGGPDFETDEAQTAPASKGLTVETLCQITGTKYYKHNEEINFSMDKIVRVYDENDALVGDVEFFEALQAAKVAKKDLVLRQEKAQPPVVKILNYRMELLKRLFQKLGKQMSEKEEKSKSFVL